MADAPIMGPAAAKDAAGGLGAAEVATPRSLGELSRLLSDTAPEGLALAARGGGSKFEWGNPPTAVDLIVETTSMDRILEHAAGDLIVRAQSGLRLADLQQALSASGQYLAVDPPEAGASLGGIVAADASGPRRFLHRSIRHHLLGMTVVLASGSVVRSGGKVVKNVAGYDLCKLFTGSLGTLGVIAECTLRVHPLPRDRRVLTAAVETAGEAAELARRAAHSQAQPSAVELDWPELLNGPGSVTALLEGSAGLDSRARQLCRDLGTKDVAEELPPSFGARPWSPTGNGGKEDGRTGLKLAAEPASMAAVLAAIGERSRRLGAPVRVSGSIGSGVLYLAVPFAESEGVIRFTEGLRGDIGAFDGSLVVLEATPELRAGLDAFGEVGALDLMRRVKERFDPARRMSPGRFVGGI